MPTNAERKRRVSRPLYHAAKIDDRRFKRVLWHYVRDETVAATGRATGLSANSVAAIFGKLRTFFVEVGLFEDPYAQPDTTASADIEAAELALLEFHLKRYGTKRGLSASPSGHDLHLAESHWRLQYAVIADQRPSLDVRPMMLTHLLEIIRLCGPVGRSPKNREAGLCAAARQIDQRAAWLERNAPEFREPSSRDALRTIRRTT